MRAIGQKEAEEVSAALAMSRSEAMRGHWEFEQRLLHHVEAEDSALLKLREVRHRLRRLVPPPVPLPCPSLVLWGRICA